MPRRGRRAAEGPTGVGQRRGGRSWLRTHWRGVSSALLVGAGAAVGIGAGQADSGNLPWWMLAGGLLAAVGAFLALLPAPRPQAPSPPSPADERAVADVANPHGRTRGEPVWNIRGPVRSFTGRDAELAAITDHLRANRRAALTPTLALYGMGGIGKTQLVRAYARTHRDQYRVGWWVPAETTLTATTALGELAVRLGAPANLPPPRLLVYLHQALARLDRWLLVFDNATDPADLEPLLPDAGSGHVLITSRNPAWQGVAEPIGVDLLSREAAAGLLRTRTGDPEHAAARALAEELGRLPLALEQAAAYAAAQHVKLGDYLMLFRQRRAELLQRGQPLAYHGTVAATVTLTLDHLRGTAPAALCLLELCALLAADELPVHQFLAVPERLPEPLATAARDPVARQETIGALYQAGLLVADVDDTVRLHRLLQAVAVDQLAGRRPQRIQQAITLLAALFRYEYQNPATWPLATRLYPHVAALLNHARGQQLQTASLATLLTWAGRYLRRKSPDRASPQSPFEQALAMRQRLHQGDHPSIASSLHELAAALQASGEVRRALELGEQALAMRQRLYNGDHPAIAMSLSNLASNLRAVDQLERARELDEQSLAMWQRLYQGDHLAIAVSLSNLATDLRLAGDLERARKLEEQSLAMWQRLYPHDHPDVAGSLHLVARDLQRFGEWERARELDERALSMQQRVYQDDHADIARSLTSLATDLRTLQEVERARRLDEQALAMWQRLDQGDHPDVARSLTSLASDLRAMGEAERASELEEQARAMEERLEGPTANTAASIISGFGEEESA